MNPWSTYEVGLLQQLLTQLAPDVICLSTRSFWTSLGKNIIDVVRNGLPDTPIVAGGWGPSLEPEKYLEYCDYVCFGEGEQAILEIGKAIDSNSNDFSHINNLIYKKKGKLIFNESIKPVDNLDLMPFPDFDISGKFLIDDNAQKTGSEFHNEKIYDIFVGRGCPLNCSYCMSGQWNSLYKINHNHKFPKTRLRSPENCIKELEIAKSKGALFIRIKDEVFPAKKSWVSIFLDLYKKRIDLPFFAYLRPEFHKSQMLEQLVIAGLKTTGLGIQTGSDIIRKEIYNRKCPNDKVMAFARELVDKNIEFHYDILCYSPFETLDNLKDTFTFLCTLPICELKVFKLAFFPGAPISEMIKKANPVGEKDSVYFFYSVLYCLATHSYFTRSVAKFMEKLGPFYGSAKILQVLFWPALFKEKQKRNQAKKKYKVSSLILPGMQKKNHQY
ncbi:MAG: radical SAM protein [Fibrobacteria bacterium]|nr:radical SAM protein [Fibrobacteria bacterium]